MIVPMGDVAAHGVIRDVPAHELPFLAWSDAKNIRFRDGAAERVLGQAAVMGTPTVAPYYCFPYADGTNLTWVYAGLAKVYGRQGGSHTNLTRQTASVDVDYSANANQNWTHGILGGIPILNNGVDPPQSWAPANLSQRLVDLPNWPANTRCGAMRVYKEFLVALDVTKVGVRYPYMVKWSHPADPGTVPTTWDETDPTKDAGEYSLSSTLDFVVDALPLRGSLMIYKEATVHQMLYTGGNLIFRFDKVFEYFGALSRRCIGEYMAKHIVLSSDDLVVHDGVQAESLLSKRQRRWLSANLDPTYFVRSFVVPMPRFEEIWACIPTIGNAFPNRALVWNHRTNTIGERDLALLSHIQFGQLDPSGASSTWGGDSASWASDTTSWDDATYNAALKEAGAAQPGGPRLVQVDSGTTDFGATYSSYLERTGIGVPLRPGDPPDVSSRKFVNRVWPRITGTTSGLINVKVGSQNEINAPVVWQDPRPYVIGSNAPIDCRLNGKLLAVRFESTDDSQWKLHGMEADVQRAGYF